MKLAALLSSINGFVLFLFTVAFAIAMSPLANQSPILSLEYVYPACMVLIAFVAMIAAFSIKTVYRMPALMISIGVLCNSVGELFWLFLTKGLNVELPYPSIADIWFVMFYPLTFIGLINLIVYIGCFEDKCKTGLLWLNRFANLLLLFSIAATILLFGKYAQADFSHLLEIFDVMYLIFDAMVLIVIIALIVYLFSAGETKAKALTPLLLIGIGYLITLGADSLFAYTSDLGLYTTGGIVDYLFLLAAYIFSSGVVKMLSIDK